MPWALFQHLKVISENQHFGGYYLIISGFLPIVVVFSGYFKIARASTKRSHIVDFNHHRNFLKLFLDTHGGVMSMISTLEVDFWESSFSPTLAGQVADIDSRISGIFA